MRAISILSNSQQENKYSFPKLLQTEPEQTNQSITFANRWITKIKQIPEGSVVLISANTGFLNCMMAWEPALICLVDNLTT